MAEKILAEYEYFKNDRFLMQIELDTLPNAKTLKAIELLGTRVNEQVARGLGR